MPSTKRFRKLSVAVEFAVGWVIIFYGRPNEFWRVQENGRRQEFELA
ncbi:hypothetical protein [Fervidibacter sp.]